MRTFLKAALVSLVGFALVFVPALSFEDFRAALDEWFKPAVILGYGLVVGVVYRMFTPEDTVRGTSAFGYGCAVMGLFPIWSTVDAFIAPGSHTLLGVEFMIYAVFAIGTGLFALIGYTLTGYVRKIL